MLTMLELYVNGTLVTVPDDVTVAAAVALAGETVFRHSTSGEPRAPLCGMGICLECRVTINGTAHVRSCQVLVKPGMDIRTT